MNQGREKLGVSGNNLVGDNDDWGWVVVIEQKRVDGIKALFSVSFNGN